MKLCAITTRSMTMKSFLIDTLNYFSQKGISVTIICEFDQDISKMIEPGVEYIPMPFRSGIESPFSIISHIMSLKKLFRQRAFDIVQYASTNAGFYASIASKKAKVPVRIFGQWGMMYMGSKGLKRRLFRFIEKTICKYSTHVQGDSRSIIEFAIKDKVLNPNKSEIIWNGSSTGVDTIVYSPTRCNELKHNVRKTLGISDSAVVFGYVGRINADKGIKELLTAFLKIFDKSKNKIFLLIVGPKENDEETNKLLDKAICNDAIKYVGPAKNPLDYYSVLDFFVLPSYREGLATVLLEAMSCGLPVLSTNILGSIDIVNDGVNGFLFEPRSVDALTEAYQRALCITKDDYNQMSKNARKLMTNSFDHDILKEKLLIDRITKFNKESL